MLSPGALVDAALVCRQWAIGRARAEAVVPWALALEERPPAAAAASASARETLLLRLPVLLLPEDQNKDVREEEELQDEWPLCLPELGHERSLSCDASLNNYKR